MLILSKNMDPRSLETAFNCRLSLDCRLSPDWRQMAIKNIVSSDPRSSIVQSVFDCRLSDMIKERILC